MNEEREIFKKICPICGRAFETPWDHKKYCSIPCKDKATVLNGVKERKKSMSAVKKRGVRSGKAKKDSDVITWDEIKAVLGEFGISQYHKAIEIIEKRRAEAKEKELQEALAKIAGGKGDD